MDRKLYFSLRYVVTQLMATHGQDPQFAAALAEANAKILRIETYMNNKHSGAVGREDYLGFDNYYFEKFKPLAAFYLKVIPNAMVVLQETFEADSAARKHVLAEINQAHGNTALQERLRAIRKADAWKEAYRKLLESQDNYEREQAKTFTTTLDKPSSQVVEFEKKLSHLYNLGAHQASPQWIQDFQASFLTLKTLCQDATVCLDKEFQAQIQQAEEIATKRRAFLTKVDGTQFAGLQDWRQGSGVQTTAEQLVELEKELQRETAEKKDPAIVGLFKKLLPGTKSAPTQVQKTYDAVPESLQSSAYRTFCYKLQQFDAFKSKCQAFESSFIRHVEVALPSVMQTTQKPVREERKQELEKKLANLERLCRVFPDEQTTKALDAFRAELRKDFKSLWTREKELQDMSLSDLKEATIILIREGFPDADVKFDLSDPSAMFSNFNADEKKREELFNRMSQVVDHNYDAWLNGKKDHYVEEATRVADKLTEVYARLESINQKIEHQSIQEAIKPDMKSRWSKQLMDIRTILNGANTKQVEADLTLQSSQDLLDQHDRLSNGLAAEKLMNDFTIQVNHTLSTYFQDRYVTPLRNILADAYKLIEHMKQYEELADKHSIAFSNLKFCIVRDKLKALPVITWENYPAMQAEFEADMKDLIDEWRVNVVNAFEVEDIVGKEQVDYFREQHEFQANTLQPLAHLNPNELQPMLNRYSDALDKFTKNVHTPGKMLTDLNNKPDMMEADHGNFGRTAQDKIASCQKILFSYQERVAPYRAEMEVYDGAEERLKPNNPGVYLNRLQYSYYVRSNENLTLAYKLVNELITQIHELRAQHENNLSRPGLDYLDETVTGLTTLKNTFLVQSPPRYDPGPELEKEQKEQHKAFATVLTEYLDQRMKTSEFTQLATAFVAMSGLKKLFYNVLSRLSKFFSIALATEAGKYANTYFNDTKKKSLAFLNATERDENRTPRSFDLPTRSAESSPVKFNSRVRTGRI